MVFILSFFGVECFKYKPQAATQDPTKNEAMYIDSLHSKDGGKKNIKDVIMQNAMEKSMRNLALFIVLTKKLDASSPIKCAAMVPKTNDWTEILCLSASP